MTWVNLCKPNALDLSLHIVPAHVLFNTYVWWMWSSKCQRILRQNRFFFFKIKNPDVFILYSMIVSVSSGTSKLHVLFLFPWKLNTVFFFWFVARNWMCPSLKTCRRERGKRLQRKRAGEKKGGGGLSHGAHEGETNRDRPAASPLTDALILPQKRSDFSLKVHPSQR